MYTLPYTKCTAMPAPLSSLATYKYAGAVAAQVSTAQPSSSTGHRSSVARRPSTLKHTPASTEPICKANAGSLFQSF